MADGNWGILQLPGDPVPGDPANARAIASFTQREAEFWQQHEQSLRATAEQGRTMAMDGDFAAPFRQRLAELPPVANALGSGHVDAGRALGRYAEQLEELKAEARAALTQGIQARESYEMAMRAYDEAVAQINALPKVVPPEQYPYVLAEWENLQARANQARAYAQEAEQTWTIARQRAVAAGEQAREAELACAQAVQAAAPRETPAGGGSAAIGAGSGVGGSAAAATAVATGPVPKDAGPAGWKPGDPIPPPLTGDRVPADAKLGVFYEYENHPTKWTSSPLPGRVHYMSDAEREASRLFADGSGRLRWAKDGSLFDTAAGTSVWSRGRGRAIFVMDRSGNLYASLEQKVGYLHHSSFLRGANVVGAGELEAYEGRLVLVTNQSGHYRPTPAMNDRVVETLEERGVIFHPTFHHLGMGS
jgi:hypothetical protein